MIKDDKGMYRGQGVVAKRSTTNVISKTALARVSNLTQISTSTVSTRRSILFSLKSVSRVCCIRLYSKFNQKYSFPR